MSKTFMYLIVTIVTYLLIVKGLGAIETTDDDSNETNKTDRTGTLENGAAGQQKYHFGPPYSKDVQEQSTNKAADDLSNKIKNDLSYTL